MKTKINIQPKNKDCLLPRFPIILHFTRTFIKIQDCVVMFDELVAILNQARCPDFVRAISHGDDIVWSHISVAEIKIKLEKVFRD